MENIGAIITAYRKKAHLSQTELAERLQLEGIEVTQKSISAWETGRNEVSARTFLHICRILEIPDCLEEYFGSNPKDPLAMLNDEGKQKALSYIEMLVHPVSYIKKTSMIPYPEVPVSSTALTRLRLYDARVSAGRGNFLDSDYYTLIDVPARDARGDQQETLDDGEIGIFSLNENAYIKKLKNDGDGTFLLSLNQKYQPIPVDLDHDDFRIFGKVCRAD